ncbi:MAG: protein-glutamate O-methyltransferase CheR [bacterium]
MIVNPAGDTDVVRWSEPGFARIAQLASLRAGLTFPENRREITESALRRAMVHTGENDAGAFAERVAREPEAYAAALTELTVGETYFFRDPAQWDLIRKEIVPELMRAHPDGHGVRVWSAGCASGEEAYTLGIVLREAGCIDPTVVGTDLCEHRLGRAARAVYTKWSMRGVEETSRRHYFREKAQYFHLLPEFRDVRFRSLNLASSDYGNAGQELSELDVILCRNVLIYIDPETCASIFARLTAALREGGWLMVAASDPQPSSDLPLEVVLTDAGLLYRKTSTPAHAARKAATAATPHVVSRPLFRRTPRASHTPVRAHARIVALPTRVTPPVNDAAQLTRAYGAADYRRAVEVANAIIAAGDDTASTWVLLARSYANRGDLTLAAGTCASGLTRYPQTAELHVVESALESQGERFNAAADAARRALYLDRTLAVAQLALGTALLRIGDTIAADRALRACERMLGAQSAHESVPASGGALAGDLLSVVRAHRALLTERTSDVA